MAAIRMLALDLDGTLVARGDEVTEQTRRALHRAHAGPIEVVIATGRRYRTSRRAVESLALDVAVVCLGGSLVKDCDHSTLHTSAFAPDEVADVARVLAAHDLALVGQRDSHALGGADFVIDASVAWNPFVAEYAEMNEPHCERAPSLVAAARTDLLVTGSFGAWDVVQAAAQSLHEQHPGRYFTNVVPSGRAGGGYYLEVVGARVSKWAGLSRLAGLRGIPDEAICAVGDDTNDLPMIRAAGIGVAMGNADAAIKDAADWVCGRNDEDGLVEVVERLLDAT